MFFRPQKYEVYFHKTYEAKQMDGVSKGLCFTLHYHPGKANVVADVLNRKLRGVLASIASREWRMVETMGVSTVSHMSTGKG